MLPAFLVSLNKSGANDLCWSINCMETHFSDSRKIPDRTGFKLSELVVKRRVGRVRGDERCGHCEQSVSVEDEAMRNSLGVSFDSWKRVPHA